MQILAGGPFGLGAPELLIILAVVVIIFGGTKLADLGGSLGKGIKEFKKNVKDEDGDLPKEQAARPPVIVASSVEARPATTESESAVVGSLGTTQAIVCPNCSALNPMGSKHCNQCGANFAAPVR
jgi:sec-independent protein translocase protein TatA